MDFIGLQESRGESGQPNFSEMLSDLECCYLCLLLACMVMFCFMWRKRWDFFAGRVMADLTEDRYVVFHDWDLTLHLMYFTVAFLLLSVKSITHWHYWIAYHGISDGI